ncbi:hypothetical protein FRACYDRAFT_240762 [Fragilariopsis cylindrus CCMP1102]|uniref:SEA domain-containing protein n=1 Tax=Fragilariopsis cylindrus CCMP1102 TaxID=635003 RepID=A0A1E7F7Q9_9STRA|nr:hypothetical protein FRACYDRAFT_240762 [Fragilariopsis cylindrus CCMP1102]|eukprot:OEU14228.1 hypothetical protein FRACYDRAFT_240762 [Fragilariopsis cylindrus CCMP1102]
MYSEQLLVVIMTLFSLMTASAASSYVVQGERDTARILKNSKNQNVKRSKKGKAMKKSKKGGVVTSAPSPPIVTTAPTAPPTLTPTVPPTTAPTAPPTITPTVPPTTAPTAPPTITPTVPPTTAPTAPPTLTPTVPPTTAPTAPSTGPYTTSPTSMDSFSVKSLPFTISYSPSTNTPTPENYIELTRATQKYLEDFFTAKYEKTSIIILDDFLTVRISEAFIQGEPVLVTYKSNALFNPRSIFYPPTTEVESEIALALLSEDYLALIQSLPRSNPFRGTETTTFSIGINLANNNLYGTLPAQISYSSSLESLDLLSGNSNFGGAFLILLLHNFKEELMIKGTTIMAKVTNSIRELNTALRVSADSCNINDLISVQVNQSSVLYVDGKSSGFQIGKFGFQKVW